MLDAVIIGETAPRRGFQRKGKATWVRRTKDFIQLVNVQRSAWAADQSYLNFALWPLALGEPSAVVESKFMFRTRAEDLGVTDAEALFDAADRLESLQLLRAALASSALSGLVSVELRRLLEQ